MQLCQPPRAVINKPKLRVPPLACDCHAHILGPPARFPYVADRSYTPPDALPDDYLRMLATLGIERMVVVQASCYGEDNRRTVAAVAELGLARARGVAMVGASVTERELDALHQGGVRATRFITTSKGGPSLEQLPGVAAKVAPFGWHIEMYVPTERVAGDPAHRRALARARRIRPPGRNDGRHAGRRSCLPPHSRAAGIGTCWTKLTGYRPSIAGPPVRGCRAAGKTLHRARARSLRLGIGLAAHEPGRLHARRRRPARPARRMGARPAVRRRILVDNPAALYRFND